MKPARNSLWREYGFPNHASRITSYNVCYTKLLRALHESRDPLYRDVAHLVVEGGQLVAAGVVQYLIREYQQLCVEM